jgi:hypothetical protein
VNELHSLQALLQTGVASAVLVGTTLWKSDKVISEDAAKLLYDKIEKTFVDPAQSPISETIERFLNRYFSFTDGIGKFIVNVFLLTAVSLLLFLSIYASRTIGLFGQLLSPGFILQFLGNGFVVTFIVNLLVLYSYRYLVTLLVSSSVLLNLLLVLADLTMKVLLFIVWTACTYVLFAAGGNAFGGDPIEALEAVPATILQAITFNDLTSVYMYSLVMSSFPIFVVVLIKVMVANPGAAKGVRTLLFCLPFKSKPLRAISSLLALFCGILALLASVLVRSVHSL